MARHVWSVLCSRVLQDVDSNRVSLIEIAEEVSVAGPIPLAGAAAPVNLTLVSYWVRSDPERGEKSRTRVDVLCPNSARFPGVAREIDLAAQDGRIQTVGRITMMPLAGAGRYEIVVLHSEEGRWRECAKLPLDVVEVPPLRSTAAPATGRRREREKRKGRRRDG